MKNTKIGLLNKSLEDIGIDSWFAHKIWCSFRVKYVKDISKLKYEDFKKIGYVGDVKILKILKILEDSGFRRKKWLSDIRSQIKLK